MNIIITVPLNSPDSFYESICAGFIKKYGNDIKFTKVQKDDIIGGFIAEVDKTVYDTSVKTKLYEIKKAIKK